MAKQINLTVPETQPNLTHQVAKSISVDLVSGVVSMVLDKHADAGPVSSMGAQWTLSPTELATLTDTLIASGQAAGQIPAGTVTDEP
jgi:hypothetical protein